MLYVICFATVLFACLLGTICGMGGGIIIKPVLDATGQWDSSPDAIMMMSGIIVICMMTWNLIKTAVKKESVIDLKNTSFLTLGAVVGGILGKMLYQAVRRVIPAAGGVQAILLFIATLLTLIYTLNKDRIRPQTLRSIPAIISLGAALGVLGAFLGIGGGPFNVAALYYFFSMKGKKAAQNSLFVVLFSQIASTLKSVIDKGPVVFQGLDLPLLAGMVLISILATEAGRMLNKRLTDEQATMCLNGAMVLIMLINVYNTIKFFFL